MTNRRTLIWVSVLVACAEYAGSVLTHVLNYVARTFDAPDARLGTVLAITRIGTLVVVAGGPLADRRGRRPVLAIAVALSCAASAATAFSRSLVMFTALQLIARGAMNLALVVGFVIVTEAAPEGRRARWITFATFIGSTGFALGALLLPLADRQPGAWRWMFAISALALPLAVVAYRRLPESSRFEALEAHGRASELVDATYGSRFVVLAVSAFLLNVMFAPSSHFTNRYLAEIRGFSGARILLLRATTQTLLAVAALWLGGRLAESWGRRPVASLGTLVVAGGTAAFFLTGGWPLWLALAIATAAGAMAGPAITAFNTELFPTEVRGTAGALTLAAGVTGSAVGLALAGTLSSRVGGIGPAVALTCVAPAIVALVLLPRLPEARGRALDDVSPPEV